MKPKLLFVIPDMQLGGALTMNLLLASALQQRGWHLSVAVLFNRCRAVNDDIHSGLELFQLGGTGVSGKVRALAGLLKLARDADVVIGGVECAATSYGYLAAHLVRKPFISWTHIAFHIHQHRLGRMYRILNRFVYRRARWVVFPSRGARDSLQEALGKKPVKAEWNVIENFIPDQSSPAGVSPDPNVFAQPVVLGIGRLDIQKAFDRLICAHATLLAKGIMHHLVILGEGSQREFLEAEIRRLGVQDSVFLCGHVVDVPRWLAHASVFALCSKYEGFSLVLLEALACGVPAVAMDCPSGPREILQDGADGLLTPEGDEPAFQEALARMLTSPELRAEYAARGRQRAEHYSAERIIPMWESLLARVGKGGYD
jgi:glycosyltransferase involved in cell wall biosynthesis